jgi:hypothetical protein
VGIVTASRRTGCLRKQLFLETVEFEAHATLPSTERAEARLSISPHVGFSRVLARA